MNIEEKKIPLGGYNIDQINYDQCKTQTKIDGIWVMARPIPYYSLKSRLRLCWDVIRYKADVVYWYKQ